MKCITFLQEKAKEDSSQQKESNPSDAPAQDQLPNSQQHMFIDEGKDVNEQAAARKTDVSFLM